MVLFEFTSLFQIMNTPSIKCKAVGSKWKASLRPFLNKLQALEAPTSDQTRTTLILVSLTGQEQ